MIGFNVDINFDRVVKTMKRKEWRYLIKKLHNLVIFKRPNFGFELNLYKGWPRNIENF
jgi:hypothetical protein